MLEDCIRQLRRLKYLKWSSKNGCRLYEEKVTDTLAIQLVECEGGYTKVSIVKLFPGSDAITKIIEMTPAEFEMLYESYKKLKGIA